MIFQEKIQGLPRKIAIMLVFLGFSYFWPKELVGDYATVRLHELKNANKPGITQKNKKSSKKDISDKIKEIEKSSSNTITTSSEPEVATTTEARSPSTAEILKYSQKNLGDVSNKVTEIRELGYSTASPLRLKWAKDAGKTGKNVEKMEVWLEEALKCYKKLGIDISDQVSEIRRLGYTAAVADRLRLARDDAGGGYTAFMRKPLGEAQEYAKKIKKDISREVIEIIKLGYDTKISNNLECARKYAEKGNVDKMELKLESALEYAHQFKRNISAKIQEIRELSKK